MYDIMYIVLDNHIIVNLFDQPFLHHQQSL
nr:MAG TPA: hypothetical protein [Caudoviricetes sp.]